MKKYFKLGVTLMELTVAMAIFLVISYLILSSTISSRATSIVAQATTYLNSQETQAISSITRELMEAKSTSITTACSFSDAGVTKYSCISFQMPILDSDGDLIEGSSGNIAYGDGTTEGNYIEYRQDQTNLVRRALMSDKVTEISRRTIARNLQPDPSRGFKTTDISGSLKYNITLVFSLTSYEGTTLPTPLSLNTNVIAAPQN